ncbi:MAG: hypothetical protein JO259_15560 [Mycobacterium sp.]|nr:hypothetical protein [Mycobacterium sp.]
MTANLTPTRALAVVFVGYTGVMLLLERRLRRTGGPGIIAFELAGTASRADAMMARWGPDGQRAARFSLWLDFGYMLTYGALTAMLLDRTRRRRGHPAVVPALAMGAVAGDAIEGIPLLKVLNGTRVAANTQRARTAALSKFAVLAVSLGYVAAGGGQSLG